MKDFPKFKPKKRRTTATSETPKAVDLWGIWSKNRWDWNFDGELTTYRGHEEAIGYAKALLDVGHYHGHPAIFARFADPTGSKMFRVTEDGVEEIAPRMKGNK